MSRTRRIPTHQSNPDLGFISGAPLVGSFVFSGTRMANRRFVVAADDWESVGGAGTPGPSGRRHCGDQGHWRGALDRGQGHSRSPNRLLRGSGENGSHRGVSFPPLSMAFISLSDHNKRIDVRLTTAFLYSCTGWSTCATG